MHGRAHAPGLAAQGARVAVNDLGTAQNGTECSSETADLLPPYTITPGDSGGGRGLFCRNESL